MSFDTGETKPTETPAASDQTPAPEVPPTPTPTGVEYGGKTLTPDEIVKKLKAQDDFIETLKSEGAAKADNTLTLLERLEALEGQSGDKASLTKLIETLKDSKPEVPSEPAPVQVPSTEELTEAVKADLKAEQLAEKRKSNMDAALDAAKEAYGDSYGDKIKEIAKAEDLTLEDVDDLAQDKPKLFRRLFLPTTKAPSVDTTRTGVVPSAVGQAPAEPPARGKAWMAMTTVEKNAEIKRRMEALRAPTT